MTVRLRIDLEAVYNFNLESDEQETEQSNLPPIRRIRLSASLEPHGYVVQSRNSDR
jgi:hypothetical protein